MKNVLLIVTRAELGGAQRVVLELATKLQKDGYAVTIGSGENGWLLDEAKKLDMGTKLFAHLSRSANPFVSIPFIAELYTYLRAQKGNTIVHLNSSNAVAGSLAAKIAGARSIFTVHGLSVLDSGYKTSVWLKAIYWAWFRLWFTFTDEIVCVSTKNAQRIKELNLGTAHVIPNGIAADKLHFMSRETAREELGIKSHAHVVMTIGRLEYSKQQEVLLRAWEGVTARIEDAKLVLVGEGPEQDALTKLAKKLKIDDAVIFAGARTEAHELLHAADVFVLPSRYEGWPIVLLEALAAKLPIIASDVGGIHEQLDAAGVLLPGDAFPDTWAGAIIALLNDAAHRKELSHVAAARSLRWESSVMAEMYESLYEERA